MRFDVISSEYVSDSYAAQWRVLEDNVLKDKVVIVFEEDKDRVEIARSTFVYRWRYACQSV